MKDTIDAQSGRFEFFKQALTLGSAGLAGIAALFTDPERIPSEPLLKLIVLLIGLAILVVVGASAYGISTYANLLSERGREDGVVVNPQTGKKVLSVADYEKGMISHAQWIFVGMCLAWGLMLIFAGSRMLAVHPVDAGSAVRTANDFVAKQTGQSGDAPMFTRLVENDSNFVVTYELQAIQSEMIVTVSKESGNVINVMRNKEAAPAPVVSAPPPARPESVQVFVVMQPKQICAGPIEHHKTPVVPSHTGAANRKTCGCDADAGRAPCHGQ